MSDDRAKKGQQDRNRIDVHEDYELRYSTEEIGVSPDELKSAAQAEGWAQRERWARAPRQVINDSPCPPGHRVGLQSDVRGTRKSWRAASRLLQ
jgi:hypothetical protein